MLNLSICVHTDLHHYTDAPLVTPLIKNYFLKICSPFFFNFLTRDFTAFSLHFSSCSDLNSPLRHPSSLFTAKGFIQKTFYGHKYSLSITRRLPNTFRTSIDWFYTVLKSKMVVVVLIVVCTIARTLI